MMLAFVGGALGAVQYFKVVKKKEDKEPASDERRFLSEAKKVRKNK